MVVIAALYFGVKFLIPITLAILLSFLLVPIVELLGRARFGRVPAVLLAVIMALGVILGFGGAIGSQFAQLASNIPQYAVTIEKKVDTVRAYTVGRIDSFVDSLGHQDAPLDTSQIPPGTRPPQRAARPGPPRKPRRPRPLRLGLRPWRSSNVISRRRCCHW